MLLCFADWGQAEMNDMDYVRYLAAMAQARVMLGKNLIAHRDFIHFEEKMRVNHFFCVISDRGITANLNT